MKNLINKKVVIFCENEVEWRVVTDIITPQLPGASPKKWDVDNSCLRVTSDALGVKVMCGKLQHYKEFGYSIIICSDFSLMIN